MAQRSAMRGPRPGGRCEYHDGRDQHRQLVPVVVGRAVVDIAGELGEQRLGALGMVAPALPASSEAISMKQAPLRIERCLPRDRIGIISGEETEPGMGTPTWRWAQPQSAPHRAGATGVGRGPAESSRGSPVLRRRNSGSGKTHLARRLSARLGLPLLELDSLNHRPGWQEARSMSSEPTYAGCWPTSTGRTRGWVVDGNYRARVADMSVPTPSSGSTTRGGWWRPHRGADTGPAAAPARALERQPRAVACSVNGTGREHRALVVSSAGSSARRTRPRARPPYTPRR